MDSLSKDAEKKEATVPGNLSERDANR